MRRVAATVFIVLLALAGRAMPQQFLPADRAPRSTAPPAAPSAVPVVPNAPRKEGAAPVGELPREASSESSNPFSEINAEVRGVSKSPAVVPTAVKVADQWMGNDEAVRLRYVNWSGDFYARSYEWHLLSTQIIFFLVVLIVMVGVGLSWAEFRRDAVRRGQAVPSGGAATSDADAPAADSGKVAPGPKLPADNTHRLKLSLTELQFDSKVIGLVILAMSLGFFYLYLFYVYPMDDPDRSRAATEARTAAK
jgi:hypothetical protein